MRGKYVQKEVLFNIERNYRFGNSDSHYTLFAPLENIFPISASHFRPMIDIVSRCLMLIEIVRHADRTCKLLGAHALSEFPLESTLTDQPPMYRSVHRVDREGRGRDYISPEMFAYMWQTSNCFMRDVLLFIFIKKI